ncbi:MAG: hypothetical protein AB1352_03100 [Patescibacteria group bacterium]
MFRIFRKNQLLFFLLGFDVVVILAHFFFKDLYGFFNLDGEQNLNSAYAGLKLFGIAALAAAQFLILRRAGEGKGKSIVWLLVAAISLYLGLDEMMALHERVGFVVNNLLGVTNVPGASFRWMQYYAPLIVIALVVYVWFIVSIWREQRTAAAFILTGILFFICALGIELIGGRIMYPAGLRNGNFSPYFASIIGEEIVELIGMTLFFAGVSHSVHATFRRYFLFRE